jgi:hypothetical protein
MKSATTGTGVEEADALDDDGKPEVDGILVTQWDGRRILESYVSEIVLVMNDNCCVFYVEALFLDQ